MQSISFEQLLDAARSLEPEQRRVLAHLLQFGDFAAPQAIEDGALVEAEVLNEAGAYSVFAPLADPAAAPGTISEAELIAAVQSISCEWEEEPV